MPPVTTAAEVFDGLTPAGLPAGTVMNLWDSCACAARGLQSSLVRSVLVQPDAENSGTLLVGYRTATPRNAAPRGLQALEGQGYDLKQVVVQLGETGDRAVFLCVR